MTRTSDSPLPGTLRRVLDRYRRRWRAVNFQRGLFLTLGLVAGTVGLAVAADRLLRLEPTLRIAALAIIGLLFVVSLARWVLWPIARRISDRDAAIRVGRHFPEFEEDLVSAVELSADRRAAADGLSRSLVSAVLRRIAGRAAGSVDHRAAVPLRPMVLTAAVFLAVAGVLLAAYLVRPESIGNALARLFTPGSAVPYFSYTRLDVTPGNQVVRVGDTAAVRVNVAGRVPETARLDGRSGSGAVRATLPCAGGQADWKSGALFDDLVYRVAAGDALSDSYRVRVVPPPALRTRSAVLRDPAYAGAEEHAVENVQGTIELVDGMEVAMAGEPVARGADPKLLCEGVLAGPEGQYPMKPDARGVLRSPRFMPHKGGEYTMTLTDGYGLRSRTPDSVFLRVRPDAVPQVAITEPGHDLMILPGERVAVAAEAHDEFAVRGLVLCQRKVAPRTVSRDIPDAFEAGPWQRRTLKDGGVKAKTLGAKGELDIAAIGLAPGDSIEYMAEAADYAGDAAQRTGSSRIWRATMMSEAQHLELVNNRLRELQTELLRRAAEQRAEAARVADLAAKPPKDTADAQNAAAAQDARDRENALAQSTDQVARKFDALIPEVARNPSAPMETLSELERLGREVSSVATGPMAQASKSLGQAAQGQEGQPQQSSLQQAEQSESQAADKLDALARAAERLQRTTALARLANEADRLAARQREVKASTEALAPKTAARRPDQLDEKSRDAVDRLASAEKSVKAGVDALKGDIQQTAASLEYQSPADAEAAREAAEKIETDKLSDTADKLAGQLKQNTLFSSIPPQESVASSLSEVAKILRQAGQAEPMAALTREIQEFIRRQKEINAQTEAAIRKPDAGPKPDVHGARQAGLGRDVGEEAAAVQELAEEIENFQSQTAVRLDKAAGEMRAGAKDLYASEFPDGLDHGKQALKLLEDASRELGQEAGQMGQAGRARQSMAAMLLLQKVLTGQKQVNRDTAAADEERTTDAPALRHPTGELAERQSGLRQDARRLQDMLSSMPRAAAPVIVAGDKMDVSRKALAEGDTGATTRIVQRQIVAALESLMADQQGSMASGSGMSAAMARMMAMLRMLQMQPGPRPGGFTGGTNAPIMPANLDKAGDEEWRRTRSRFEGSLSEGAEESYPVQFRDLLNSYFDRLRKEPPR